MAVKDHNLEISVEKYLAEEWAGYKVKFTLKHQLWD